MEKFFGSSGIALEYKLQPLEYLCGIKESNFRKGLTRRLEILCDYLSIKNASFDFSSILISFNRNTVADLASVYDTVLKLHGIISDETLLEQLPNIDKDIELQRLEEQKERNIEEFGLPINKEPLNEEEKEEDEEVVEE